MARKTVRISIASLMALMLMIGWQIGIGGVAAPSATAQGAAWECAPPATLTAAASPVSATTAAPAASPIAFPADGGELIVFAAASLTDTFDAIKTDLEAANPGLTVTYNFAGSQALVTQVTEGAEADVLALASATQMRAAVENGIVEGTGTIFTQNRLAIVVTADNPGGVQSPADLGKDGLKLVLAQAEVPVGQYARESVCKMAAETATYGDDFTGSVAGNVVSEEDNVRAVLAKVQLGEADAGIVYTTDVTAEVAEDVTLIEIPQPVNVVARYPVAPVTGGDAALAQAFIGYILGPEGQATLQEFGFEPKP